MIGGKGRRRIGGKGRRRIGGKGLEGRGGGEVGGLRKGGREEKFMEGERSEMSFHDNTSLPV